MPPIVEDQTFKTLADFKEALRLWAIEANWTPHILDSDSHRVRAGCRSSPDCPFRIRANYSTKRGDARVTTVEDVHNCERYSRAGPAHQNIKRAETGKLKFLLEAVPKIINVSLDTTVQEIINAIEKKYGQKIPVRQAQKVKSGLVTRVKGPCRHCHRMGHTKRHCPQLKGSNSGQMDFSNNDSLDFSRDNHEGATYSDSAIDNTFNSEAMDYSHNDVQQQALYEQSTRPPADPYTAAGANIDPGLENGVENRYGAPRPPQGRTRSIHL